MKKILGLIVLIVVLLAACKDDDNQYGANLSFSRSLYILPAVGSLDVELRISPAPEKEMTIPVQVEGTAVLNEDYEMSAGAFTVKAGETSSVITFVPKDNLTEGREIRLALAPQEGYGLGEKKVAIIPVEVKERIMFSFLKPSARLLSETEVWVEIQGEQSGTAYRAPSDIAIPFEILEGGTAILGSDFEITGNSQVITIPRGSRQTKFTVKLAEGVEDYAGKYFTLKLFPPVDNPELYYVGTFETYTCKLDQLKFSDLVGKWEPVGIVNKDLYAMMDIPAEDYEGALPEQNGTEDYLEFVHEGSADKIIPHLTGGLKNFFVATEHPVAFHEIRSYDDFSEFGLGYGGTYDIPYFKVSGVNRLFSSSKQETGDADIGLAIIDADNIVVYFHDYVPTDFFVQTYKDYDETFFDWAFGITYQFTRVQE